MKTIKVYHIDGIIKYVEFFERGNFSHRFNVSGDSITQTTNVDRKIVVEKIR